MTVLADKLVAYLNKEVGVRLTRLADGCVHPVLVGPPLQDLYEVFRNLTEGYTQDWHVPDSNGNTRVPVLLVVGSGEHESPTPAELLSQYCNWDYAVSIRNSTPNYLTLVNPVAWDSRPESIVNTMEMLGTEWLIGKGGLQSNDLWRFLAEEVEIKLSVPNDVVAWALELVNTRTRNLGSKVQREAPWVVVRELFELDSRTDFVRVIGLPALGDSNLTVSNLIESNKVLHDLAKLCSTDGLQGAEEKLTNANELLLGQGSGWQDVSIDLLRLFNHLRTTAVDGTVFWQSPVWYFRTRIDTEYWDALTYEVLRTLLSEAGVRPPLANLVVRCTNSINRNEIATGEPNVVVDEVVLSVQAQECSALENVHMSRQIGRRATVELGTCDTNGVFIDDDVPEHDQVLKYGANCDGFRPANLEVVSLASFACHGFARVVGSSRNPAPSKSATMGQFEQEITVGLPGNHVLFVFHSYEGAVTRLLLPDGSHMSDSSSPAQFDLDIDDSDEITVLIADPESELVMGSWKITFAVEEARGKASQSRLEALMKAHRENRPRPGPVIPRAVEIRRLEETYIREPMSWRGVQACWSGQRPPRVDIDFGSGMMGDVRILTDASPPGDLAAPPEAYLEARERVRTTLSEYRRSLPEAQLCDPEFLARAEDYIHRYKEWLSASPESAAWSDCIAIYGSFSNVQAGIVAPTGEPVAILLSPLHPLRIGWHAYAQKIMTDGLDTIRCPAAYLLDDKACPAIAALPIFRGGSAQWRAFFASGCSEAHWAVLWNRHHLDASDNERAQVARILEQLGILPSGFTTGFTSSQTRKAIDDVSSILCTRSSLHVGVVSSGEEITSCVDGLLDWGEETFGESEHGTNLGHPKSWEIYDLRENPKYPSPASLAVFFEVTAEKTRWYQRGPTSGPEKMDLVILDQVGAMSPLGIRAESRSSIAPGLLFRINIREDTGDASRIQESRACSANNNQNGLGGTISEAAIQFESLAANDEGISHVQYQPNREAIGQRLAHSRFVAATSSQVDPACFIRGSGQEDAYLWDFELPGAKAVDEQRAGYYLIAKPTTPMMAKISDTARLVSSNPPPIEELLDEVSRRGIPVLKRLARGGAHSRGELGVMLAVRLLQDAFRVDHEEVRLPVVEGNKVHLLLPVDSYWEPLELFRKARARETSGEHPDLIVFCIQILEPGSVVIKATPVEVKLRGSVMTPVQIRDALGQASNLGILLDRLWAQEQPNEVWATCSSAFLALCLDHAFRIYADPRVHGFGVARDWTRFHQETLDSVLGRRAEIIVNRAGRLLVFDKSADSTVADMDGDRILDTAIISPDDAEKIMNSDGELSEHANSAIEVLDFSLPTSGTSVPTSNTGTGFRSSPAMLDVGESSDSEIEDNAETDEQSEAIEETEAGEGDEEVPEAPQPIESPVPPEVRLQVRSAFAGFIGNEPAVRRISNDLLAALIDEPPHLSKNYLLTGQPSTGKTEMARRMAVALGVPFVPLDGRAVTSRERLFTLINGELSNQGTRPSLTGNRAGLPQYDYPPLMVFIDEVHLVPRAVQESMLTMLESADRTVMLNDQVAVVNRATFLFATTRASALDDAFRSRCTEVSLKEYTAPEVAEIVSLRFRHDDWPLAVYLRIATLGRLVPRIALELASELETMITVSEHREYLVQGHLEELRTIRELDDLGLTNLDISYLDILERESRPLGEQNILSMMGIADRHRVIGEVEPFLRRLGFVRMGQSGREITETGRDYLLERRRNQGQD